MKMLMMKKYQKVIAFVFAGFVALSLAVYGASELQIGGWTQLIKTEYTEEIIISPEILSQFEANALDVEEYNDMVYLYLYLHEGYNSPKEQVEYVNSLILNGYNMQDIFKCYSFWLDTNEDIGIIESMCRLKEKYQESIYWTENAFNEATGNKHGVLNMDDVQAYIDAGLNRDDISAANVLSRQGKFTIQELLDRKLMGTSFEELVEETAQNSGIQNKLRKPEVRKIKRLNRSSDIHLLKRYSYLTKEKSLPQNTEGIDELLSKRQEEIEKSIYKKSKRRSQFKKSASQIEKDESERKAYYAKIIENGISEEDVSAMREKGYRYIEIYNASELSRTQKRGIAEIIKEVSGDE